VITCHTHKLKTILTDYIYHQNEKSKPREMDLPLLESDIPTNLESGQTICSYHKKEIGKPSKKDLLKTNNLIQKRSKS